MTKHCTCASGCKDRAEMRVRHGTPAEFKRALAKALSQGFLTTAEMFEAVELYQREWDEIGEGK